MLLVAPEHFKLMRMLFCESWEIATLAPSGTSSHESMYSGIESAE